MEDQGHPDDINRDETFEFDDTNAGGGAGGPEPGAGDDQQQQQPQLEPPPQQPPPQQPPPNIDDLFSRDEAEAGDAVGVNSSAAINYLNSPEASAFTDHQKDAFFYLCIAHGLEPTAARFAPGLVDPASVVSVARLRASGFMFTDINRLLHLQAAQAAVPPPVEDPVPAIASGAAPTSGRRLSIPSGSVASPLMSSTRISGPPARAPFTVHTLPAATHATRSPAVADEDDFRSRLEAIEAKYASTSMRNSLLPGQDDSDHLISAPKLGSNDNIAAAQKNLKACGNFERFSLDDVMKHGSTNFQSLLPVVKKQIENQKLDEETAYMLFQNILKGDLQSILNAKQREGEPFEDAWRSIQLLAHGAFDRTALEKELNKLLTVAPSSVAATFSRISILIGNMHQHIADVERRGHCITYLTLKSIKSLLHNFYPHHYSAIENLVELKRGQVIGKFNEVSSLIEIAVNYINKRSAEIGVTHVRMAPMIVQIDSSAAVESNAPSSSHHQEQQQQQAVIQPQQTQQPQHQQQQQQSYQPRYQQPYQPRYQQNYRPGNNNMNGNRPPRNPQQQQRFNGPPQQQQRQQQPSQQQQLDQGFIKGNCFKCNKANHWSTQCRTYANPYSFDRCCKFCSGYHVERCVTLGPRQPSNGSNSSNGRRINGQGSNISPQHKQEQQRQREEVIQSVSLQTGAIGSGQALPGAAYLTATSANPAAN